jgi:hypothetical protein
MTLLGVVSGTTAAAAIAMIRVGEQEYFVRQGERVDQYRVVRIDPEEVVLTSADKTRLVLRIGQAPAGAAAAEPTPVSRGMAAPSGNRPAAVAVRSAPAAPQPPSTPAVAVFTPAAVNLTPPATPAPTTTEVPGTVAQGNMATPLPGPSAPNPAETQSTLPQTPAPTAPSPAAPLEMPALPAPSLPRLGTSEEGEGSE